MLLSALPVMIKVGIVGASDSMSPVMGAAAASRTT